MSAEVHFIHSGDGDTILIRGGDQWGLVDANFVQSLRVRDEVEKLLHGVKRLRFVCVTHFDVDHIRGLGKFLRERFSESDGRGGIRWLVDQIILPIEPASLELLISLRNLSHPKNGRRLLKGDLSGEAHALLEVLCEMGEGRLGQRVPSDHPEFLCLFPREDLVGPPLNPLDVNFGPWRCRCLGPRKRTSSFFTRQFEAAFQGKRSPKKLFRRVDANAVSRVLVFQHQSTDCALLFTGDATVPELKACVTEWRRICAADGRRSELVFRAVKASHHGARTCHLPEIYAGHCQPGYSHVAICASDDGRHPHQDVIVGIAGASIEHSVTGTNFTGAPPRPRGANVPLGAPRSRRNTDDPHVRVVHSGAGFIVSGGRRSRYVPADA